MYLTSRTELGSAEPTFHEVDRKAPGSEKTVGIASVVSTVRQKQRRTGSRNEKRGCLIDESLVLGKRVSFLNLLNLQDV